MKKKTEQKKFAIIKDFSNYVVTKDGKVFNLSTGKEMHQYERGEGYKWVCLRQDLEDGSYKYKHVSVSCLVAKAFGPTPTEQKEMTIIKDFSNYAVTKDGKVFNLTTGRELKQCDTDRGYKYVTLYQKLDDGSYEKKDVRVHRLVAEAFVIKPKYDGLDKRLDVHHIDFNRENNAASNLIWITHVEHAKFHAEHNKMLKKNLEEK